MTSIQQQLNQMQGWTSQQEALKAKTEGTSNEMNQDMFLKLLMEQLKYQDPLNPMDNTEFLSQQAQFTQIEQLQKLNESVTSNNSLTQGMDLIGKKVTLMDPDDPKKTISGIVDEAIFYQNGCAVKVNGKEYPAGLILTAKPGDSPDVETPPTDESGKDDAAGDKDKDDATQSAENKTYTPSISKISDAVEYIAKKISEYTK